MFDENKIGDAILIQNNIGFRNYIREHEEKQN